MACNVIGVCIAAVAIVAGVVSEEAAAPAEAEVVATPVVVAPDTIAPDGAIVIIVMEHFVFKQLKKKIKKNRDSFIRP